MVFTVCVLQIFRLGAVNSIQKFICYLLVYATASIDHLTHKFRPSGQILAWPKLLARTHLAVSNDGFPSTSLFSKANPFLPVVCGCVHGVCNSGIAGDGSCTCLSGYKGLRCDQRKWHFPQEEYSTAVVQVELVRMNWSQVSHAGTTKHGLNLISFSGSG